MSATVARKYANIKEVQSIIAGSVQKLSNGNMMINYGANYVTKTMFNVITPSGDKIFEIEFKYSVASYRAFNYPDLPWNLKRPEVASFEKDGKLYLGAGSGYGTYSWPMADRDRVIEVTKAGDYFVFVPIGSGAFISSPHVVVILENDHYRVVKNESRKKNL